MLKYLHQKIIVKDESGAVAVFIGVLLIIFMGIAALAIDAGYLLLVKNELKNVSDAAALAAARQLGVIYESQNYNTQLSYDSNSTTAIRDAAQNVALLNKAGNVNIVINNTDVEIGIWDINTKTFAIQNINPNFVRVTSRRDSVSNWPITTFFAKVFGVNLLSVTSTVCAALTPRTTAPTGTLGLPVAISSQWFVNNPNFCDLPIDLYPPGTPQGCVGWHVFTTPPANDAKVRAMINDMIAGTYVSPITEANITQFIFVKSSGGPKKPKPPLTKATLLKVKDLYDANKNAANEWETHIAVYDSNDCINPNGNKLIVGFATVIVTSVDVENERIEARVVCGNVEPGRGSGVDYGTMGSIPGLVQ